jgi:hypothetical protein
MQIQHPDIPEPMALVNLKKRCEFDLPQKYVGH